MRASTYRELGRVSLQHPLQVQLLDLSLQPGGQPGVHGGAAGQDNVLVELGTSVNVGSLGERERQWEQLH